MHGAYEQGRVSACHTIRIQAEISHPPAEVRLEDNIMQLAVGGMPSRVTLSVHAGFSAHLSNLKCIAVKVSILSLQKTLRGQGDAISKPLFVINAKFHKLSTKTTTICWTDA